MDKLRKKYSMHLQVLCPDTKEVEEMVNAKGQNLFYESTENRILCCKVRKVNPIIYHRILLHQVLHFDAIRLLKSALYEKYLPFTNLFHDLL